MTVVYLDCAFGAAGDMILAALLDAGVPEDRVRAQLDALSLEGWDLSTRRTARGGIGATQVIVTAAATAAPRRYRDIKELIERSPLRTGVKERALAILRRLAEAEARIHDSPVDDVHFHEVGAVDSIVDIVGVAAALDHLEPWLIVTSPLSLGSGTIQSSHGTLPVPAPAVTELLRGAPVRGGGEGEVVTPTGAAIVVAVSDRFGDIPDMVLESSGYGAGARERDVPNVVRVLIGRSHERKGARQTETIIECNLDDMSPELLPHVIDVLLAAGADDAWVTPIVMKKGRPAHQLSVLCPATRIDDLLPIVFSETTTLGLRLYEVRKEALERRRVEVDVDGVPVRVKIASYRGRDTTLAPEHDDARAAAVKLGIPLKEVYARALAAARPDGVES